MNALQEADQRTENFIEQWLHHFGIHYTKNVTTKNASNTIDYYLPEQRLVIMIPNWKRPIAVSVINTAVIACNELELNQILIIASQVSDYAQETVQRINYPIKILNEYALTDLLKYILPQKQVMQQLA